MTIGNNWNCLIKVAKKLGIESKWKMDAVVLSNGDHQLTCPKENNYPDKRMKKMLNHLDIDEDTYEQRVRECANI